MGDLPNGLYKIKSLKFDDFAENWPDHDPGIGIGNYFPERKRDVVLDLIPSQWRITRTSPSSNTYTIESAEDKSKMTFINRPGRPALFAKGSNTSTKWKIVNYGGYVKFYPDGNHLQLSAVDMFQYCEYNYLCLLPDSNVIAKSKMEISTVPRALLSDLKAPGINFDLPDLNEVQGDVVFTFPKTAEDFIFFDIIDLPKFRSVLSNFTPTTSNDVIELLFQKMTKNPRKSDPTAQVQIAFSKAGLRMLGVRDRIGDKYFDDGPMRKHKESLGDGLQWDEVFDRGGVHGCFVVSAEGRNACRNKSKLIRNLFRQSTNYDKHVVIEGRERPYPHQTKEHFGYRDGISEPAIRGLVAKHKGQIEVDPGVIVMGYKSDPALARRPKWAKNGSIMVFRKLEQDVPEFNNWLTETGKSWRSFAPKELVDSERPLSNKEGAALLGARMFGRYKSGTPVVLRPFRELPGDQKKAEDFEWNNDFDYMVPGESAPSARYCPFSAHTRKVTPRNLGKYYTKNYLESAMILRAGIAYGPEVTQGEREAKKSKLKRGLLFVCYQSSLEHGFIRQTRDFANMECFPKIAAQDTKHGQSLSESDPFGTKRCRRY
ncbi:hypothetical protein FRC04_003302 [Tulasnella sp. 424]|nr:hypothetical protein FRC04_003302 [Tulasnella sp. 424]